MSKPKLFDVVKLTSPAPEHGLAGDELGTIVEEYAVPGEAYEVEFANEYGETIAMFSLTPDEFEVVVPYRERSPREVGV